MHHLCGVAFFKSALSASAVRIPCHVFDADATDNGGIDAIIEKKFTRDGFEIGGVEILVCRVAERNFARDVDALFA